MTVHDLLVIGGGTAGLTAAVGAVGVGARVVLAEEHRTGGDCLWTGCVPSKALIATARRAHAMRTADEVALDPVDPTVDLGRVMARVHDTIATIEPHDSPDRPRRLGIEVVAARARLASTTTASIAAGHEGRGAMQRWCDERADASVQRRISHRRRPGRGRETTRRRRTLFPILP